MFVLPAESNVLVAKVSAPSWHPYITQRDITFEAECDYARIQITTPDATFAVELEGDRVINAAPFARRLIGMRWKDALGVLDVMSLRPLDHIRGTKDWIVIRKGDWLVQAPRSLVQKENP